MQNLLSYHLAHLYNIAVKFQMFFNNYHYILLNNTLVLLSISLALSISVLFISLLQLTNGAQFLNIAPLFLSSACLAAASAPALVIVILPLTSMYALL